MSLDWDYIAGVCKSEFGHRHSHIIHSPDFLTGDERETFLQPPLLLWDPMSQLTQTLVCPFHALPLAHTQRWTDNQHRPARKLYDIGGIAYLCSAYYQCSVLDDTLTGNKHLLIATDEGLLAQINTNFMPFFLTKRCGVTTRLKSHIVQRIMEGNHFQELEKSLADMAAQQMNEKLFVFNNMHNTQYTYEYIEGSISSLWPSNTFITELFIADFRMNEHVYKEKLQDIAAADILSMDHTFKVSSNIGYVREDGTWVSLYENLFIVLNESGQVLGYKLTKSTAFDAIENVLDNIKIKLVANGVTNVLAIIDNCCQWSNKLKSTFQPIVVDVKLDIFHGITRVTSTVPYSNSCRAEMVKDFRLSVRSHDDKGRVRKEPTPDSSCIKTNITSFLSRWQHKTDTSQHHILAQTTEDAISKLVRHIDRGCLSNIPVGCGTNKNERLHKLLNNSPLCVARIGPELAEALLTVIFYKWNINKLNSGEYRPVPPVSYLLQRHGNIASMQQEIPTTPPPPDEYEVTDENTCTMLLQKAKTVCHIYDNLLVNTDTNMDICGITNFFMRTSLVTKVYASTQCTKDTLSRFGYKNSHPATVLEVGATYGFYDFTHSQNIDLSMQQLAESHSSVIVFCGELTAVPLMYVSNTLDTEKDVIVLAVKDNSLVLTVQLQSQQLPTLQAASNSKRPHIIHCRCGVNNDNNSMKCQKKRCQCWRNNKGCGKACYCRHCANEFGKRPAKSQQQRKKKLQSQRRLLPISSTTFLTKRKQAVPGGKWTVSESILLIITKAYLDGQNRIGRDASNSSILDLFKQAQVVNTTTEHLKLNSKTNKQIIAKLAHLKKMVDTSTAMLGN